MRLDKIINPFLLLPMAFVFVIWMYTWGWSVLCPDLTWVTYLFFCVFLVVLIVVGLVFSKCNIIRYSDISIQNIEKHNPVSVVVVMMFLFMIDVVYSGTIPLFGNNIDDYTNFGMPIVDPLILTLIIFYSIYWFHIFLSTKQKKFLIFVCFAVILCVLMARRSILIYVFVSMLCVIVQKLKRIKILVLTLFIGLICFMGYFFGFLGTAKTNQPASYMVEWMGGSDKFIESVVADEYYITYLYAVSPMANFQLTVQDPVRNKESFLGLVLSEFVPDFISNRLRPLIGFENYPHRGMSQVAPTLNVGTYYVHPYIIYGWIGVAISCVYLFLFAFVIYLLYPANSQYHVVMNAFLCAIFLMTLFANVFRIFSVDMVFIIPLLVQFYERVRIKKIVLMK